MPTTSERSDSDPSSRVLLYLQFLVWGGPTSSLKRAYRAPLRDSPLIPSPHSFSALMCETQESIQIKKHGPLCAVSFSRVVWFFYLLCYVTYAMKQLNLIKADPCKNIVNAKYQ